MSISVPWPTDAAGTRGESRRRPRRRSAQDLVAQAAFGGGDDEPVEWETVYWASALEEAHIVGGSLEAEGIPVLLRSESASAYGSMAISGVRVCVPLPLADRARQVLEGNDRS